MNQNRALSQDEREEVLAHVKPTGAFKPPKQRTPFGVQAVPWENKLGNLDEYREHKGMGRAVVPVLSSATKSQSVCSSIMTRLRRLHPDESWTAYVDGRSICVRFNGEKRSYGSRRVDESTQDSNSGSLFAETG